MFLVNISILDEHNRLIFTIKGKRFPGWTKWNIYQDEKKVGIVKKIHREAKQELFDGANTLDIVFPKDIVAQDRILLMMAGVSKETT
jgi:hypothetical protein